MQSLNALGVANRAQQDSIDRPVYSARDGPEAPDLAAQPGDVFLVAVERASAEICVSTEAILFDFGEHVVPDIIRAYRQSIRVEWDALDILEFIDFQILGAFVPDVSSTNAERVRDREIRLRFRGHHHICHLMRGIVRGISRIYDQRLDIHEDKCERRGGDGCIFSVSVN